MSAVICLVRAGSSGGGGSAIAAVRKKEVLSVPGTSALAAEAGEYAVVLNTETSAVLVAFGSTPDAQATTATAATTAGFGVSAGLESPLFGPLASGDKISVKTVA